MNSPEAAALPEIDGTTFASSRSLGRAHGLADFGSWFPASAFMGPLARRLVALDSS
jgi:hypothetical protein